MSTKCSIKYGDNFHFYREVFDNHNVYLQLEGIEYWTDNKEVTVVIPVEIWETIKGYNAVNFEYKDLSDNAILEMVKSQLDDFLTIEDNNPDNRLKNLRYRRHFDKDGSYEDNIKSGVGFYTDLRDKELVLFEKIERVKAQQRR